MIKYIAGIILTIVAAATWAADYEFDADHSFASFEIMHNNTSTIRGRFDNVSGKIEFDAVKQSAQVEALIEVNSINTGSQGFNKHLLSADLFNVAKYPQMKFVSRQSKFTAEKITSLEGDLTLLGKTLPVTLQATNFNCYVNKRSNRQVCGGDFVAVIERTNWGMDFAIDAGFAKDIKVFIQVEAVKK